MYSHWLNPHLPETPSPACEQTNISDKPHNLHTRTCSEQCVGDAARYRGQLFHTNFYPTISGRYTTRLWSFPLLFFKANWEQFHDVCLEIITENKLEETDHLHSFVEYITNAANDCIPRATAIPKKSNPWFDEECREAPKTRSALDKRVNVSDWRSMSYRHVLPGTSSEHYLWMTWQFVFVGAPWTP